MSCQLSLLANFQDIDSVRKYLFQTTSVSENVKSEGNCLQIDTFGLYIGSLIFDGIY